LSDPGTTCYTPHGSLSTVIKTPDRTTRVSGLVQRPILTGCLGSSTY